MLVVMFGYSHLWLGSVRYGYCPVVTLILASGCNKVIIRLIRRFLDFTDGAVNFLRGLWSNLTEALERCSKAAGALLRGCWRNITVGSGKAAKPPAEALEGWGSRPTTVRRALKRSLFVAQNSRIWKQMQVGWQISESCEGRCKDVSDCLFAPTG